MPFYGIEKAWLANSIKGGLTGTGFMLLNKLTGFASMATPYVPLSITGQWIVILGIAPFVETFIFITILLSFLTLLFKIPDKNDITNPKFLVAAIIDGLSFALYHIKAYAQIIELSAILSVSGAFIAAFLFGVLACYLARRWGFMAAASAHLTINLFLVLGLAIVF